MKRALDLFCGGGGAARGILAAGFDEVVGIDIADHRKAYPGHFVRGDALRPPVRLEDFDFVWASPPCQAFSYGNNINGDARRRKPDHIPATRALLEAHPATCIENVPGSPIRADVILTGPMVGLDRIYRPRHFETSFAILAPPPMRPFGRLEDGSVISVTKNGTPYAKVREARVRNGLPPYWSVDEMRDAMGCPPEMTRAQVGEAVPPAYAEFIAREALRQMQ